MPKDNVVYLGRNPFARESLVRRVVESSYSIKPTCSWCGNRRWRKGKEVYSLFEYGIDPDGGKLHWLDGLFCSVSCFVTYHDFPKDEF